MLLNAKYNNIDIIVDSEYLKDETKFYLSKKEAEKLGMTGERMIDINDPNFKLNESTN